MNLLQSATIRLRALEPEDIEILYRWENNTDVWGVSHTLRPFSRYLLRQFVLEQAQEIHRTGQVRFVIETLDGQRPVGVIDLYDFDPVHARAGVGILIYKVDDRGRGYAAEALLVLARYAFKILGLNQIYANIGASNEASRRLFERCGFRECGIKQQWLRTGDGWEDEVMVQLFKAC